MKSYAIRLSQIREVTNLLTGQQTVTSFAGATYDDFTVVSGFGKNPGRIFIDPTPGEYKKQYWDSTHGVSTIVSRNTYTGAVESSTMKRGYHGDEVGGSMHSQYAMFYDSTTYNNALSDVYDGIRNSSINTAVMLAEFKETKRMLHLEKSVYELLLLARKARRKAKSNPSKLFSEVWLGWKYGWEPTLKETYGMLNWLYRAFDDGQPFRGRASRYEKPSYTYKEPSYPYRETWIDGKRIWRCEVKLWVGLGSSDAYNLSRITSLNPVSIAWELVPLSFVCDWFLDVGGYLQNMEAALASGLTFKKGYVTEIAYSNLTQHHRYPGKPVVSGSSTIIREGYLKNAKFDVWKRRQKLNGFPFPRAPRLEVKLGFQRIVSLVALVRTVILGGIADDEVKKKLPRKKKPKYNWDDLPDRQRRVRK